MLVLGLLGTAARLILILGIVYVAASVLGIDLSAVIGGWVIDQINPFAAVGIV